MEFELALKKSTLFYECNKDFITEKFNGKNELFSMELDSTVLAKLFDQYAGIDYVLINKGVGKIYGIAARVNFWSETIGHLTIRYKRKSGYKTEYEKRLSSISMNDSFYPHITIQIDSDKNNKAISGILVKTKELYAYIESNKEKVINKYMRTCSEGNNYLAIPYSEIQDNFLIPSKIF